MKGVRHLLVARLGEDDRRGVLDAAGRQVHPEEHACAAYDAFRLIWLRNIYVDWKTLMVQNTYCQSQISPNASYMVTGYFVTIYDSKSVYCVK